MAELITILVIIFLLTTLMLTTIYLCQLIGKENERKKDRRSKKLNKAMAMERKARRQ